MSRKSDASMELFEVNAIEELEKRIEAGDSVVPEDFVCRKSASWEVRPGRCASEERELVKMKSHLIVD